MKKDVTATVSSLHEVAQSIYIMELSSPEWTGLEVTPGCFAHIALRDSSRLLRRPISVMDFDANDGMLKLAFRVVGEGTAQLAQAREGEAYNVMLPLGRGFDISGRKRVLALGGGMGAAPIYFAAKRFSGGNARFTTAFGFKTAAQSFGTELEAALICTDDGTLGQHALLPELLDESFNNNPPDLVLACGPTGMLKAVQRLLAEHGIEGQLSLEARMGCGMGACLCCNQQTGGGYLRVCADGPVFPANEVIFDD